MSATVLAKDYGLSPDGIHTTWLIRDSNKPGVDVPGLWQSAVLPIKSECTLSLRVRAASGDRSVKLSINEIGSFYFNPSAKTQRTEGSVERTTATEIADGFFVVSLSVLSPAGSVSYSIRLASGDLSDTLSGDGVSGIEFFGADFKVGKLSPWIFTESTPVSIVDYSVNSVGVVTLPSPLPIGAELLWTGSYEYHLLPHTKDTVQEIIREIRAYLLDALVDALPTQVIQNAQNYASLPHGAIVIHILMDSDLDKTVTTYDSESSQAAAQTSKELRVQLDFYGPEAESRSAIIAGLWHSYYTTDRLKLCKPLYVQSRERHPYINDSNQYENRYILDLALQYNPQVTYRQDFTNSASITIIPVREG